MPKRELPSEFELQKLRVIADIQFGKGAGKVLFPDNITVERSRATNRIKYVFLGDKRICSFRVQDGYLTLAIAGGELLNKHGYGKKVTISAEAEPFVREGKSVFSKYVKQVDDDIGIRDEVIIVNENSELIAIGTAKLSSKMMLEFDRGVAVVVRKGKKIKNTQ